MKTPKRESASVDLAEPENGQDAAETALADAKVKGIKDLHISKYLVKPTRVKFKVEGMTSLIVHKFSEKASKMIREKQEKGVKVKKEAKDPFVEFLGSLYIIDERKLPKEPCAPGDSWPFIENAFGFPAAAFKASMCEATRFLEGIDKVFVKGTVHIPGVFGDLLPIRYKKLVNRQDEVRIGRFPNRTADIRFRGEFLDWEVDLPILFNANVISMEQIGALLANAGFHIGVGEWRASAPVKGGSHGAFQPVE